MAKRLWGGRFKKETDKDFFKFQKSIQYDHKLAEYDILHSLIHVRALHKAGILSLQEKNKLLRALKGIQRDIKMKRFKYDITSEDIHTDIQNKVGKRVGGLALKLQTLRSRNDQVAFDEKCFCVDSSGAIDELLKGLLNAITYLRGKYKNISMVGYTHTQRAQKIYFKDYMAAFYKMFERDRSRLSDFLKHITIHIGAGALAGSSIKGDYSKAIKLKIGKTSVIIRPSVNSVDDVSDRDFIVEFLSIISIIQMHLSRLAEDLILYSTKEFDFIILPEEFCTGSSLMPQKKNADFLELVRGYAGRAYANLFSVLTTMKGLPLSYNRDMQLDKEPLFSSIEIMENELSIIARLIKKTELNIKSIKKALIDPSIYAVDEAEKLVRTKAIAFKKAHDIIGKKIRKIEKD